VNYRFGADERQVIKPTRAEPSDPANDQRLVPEFNARSPQVSGLKREYLAVWEVMAQSVANIAPVAGPTLIIPLVFDSARGGTWLVYLAATIAMLLVSYHVNQFARRSASAGALYTFVFQGLGPTWGAISGWSLLIAYLGTAAAVLAGSANYVIVLVHLAIGARIDLAVALGAMLAVAGICWWLAYKDIRLSARFMLLVECCSVGLILIVAFAFIFKTGRVVDHAQLALAGASASGIRLGLVLAIFSFVGFESATALGREARDPLRSIPRAVVFSVVLAGAFFVFMSYILVLAFRGAATSLGSSNAPLSVLAAAAGIPVFGVLIALGAAMSQCACGLASITAAARVMYTMGQHGLLHASTRNVHESHATPHVAVTISSFVAATVPVALLLRHVAPLDIFGYLGSVATFGFLVAYLLIAIGGPSFLRRRGELGWGPAAISAAAVILLLLPLMGSIYPEPPTPYNYLPYVFLMLLLLGGARFAYLRLRHPARLREIEESLRAEQGT
jgi:amino acid transporter